MVSFRLSEKEKALIAERAKLEGLTLSEYCRMVLTGIVLQLSPKGPTIALPTNLKPPQQISQKSQIVSVKRPSALPAELLIELKDVLQKYYIPD